MTEHEQEPTVREGKNGQCDSHEEYSHPAFGTITMTTSHGGNDVLFGSDIGHNSRICVTINEATLKRDLNRDWIFGNKIVCEINMSHAQFAQFITSNGNGGGTPCTLRYTQKNGNIPAIKKIESKHETFRREIRDAAKKRLDDMNKKVKELGDMIESGKLPKKELRELHMDLARFVGQLPGTMEFVVKSAEEALEKATSDAKVEVESYIQMTAQKLGVKSIQQLAQLEDKREQE